MARWLVSDGSYAREVTKPSVSVAGVNNDILRAVVSENGIWRQFWPAEAPTTPSDPRIIWDATPLTVRQSVNDPEDSSATITFDRDTGIYTYNNAPNADGNGVYLNPAVTGTGQYLIKVDDVSGTPITGTTGVWIDLFSAASFAWSLDQTVVGVLDSNVNITIAADAGGGTPVTSTQIVKEVTFTSQVVASTLIAWTGLQRDLVEITETVDADCVLTLNPSGGSTGSADTSGSFNENWHVSAPSVPDPENFTVNTALVSGTAPDGDALGVDLTLDLTRQWTLPATSGEDVSCELNVTVSDGVNPITKVVTMRSQRTVPDSTNVWTADPPWSVADLSEGGTAGVDILVKEDGTAEAVAFNLPGSESQAWNSEAPTPSDPENYETQLQLVSGDASAVTGPLNQWFTLPNVAWGVALSTPRSSGVWVFDLFIRRIGGVSVAKSITARLSTE